MTKHAVYCGTRNIYGDMETAAKSLVANSDVDVVHFVIEDLCFPRELPSIVHVHDVSGQEWFRFDGPNMTTRFTYMEMMRSALCHVLPDVERVVSFDCDVICVGDVSQLWKVDLADAYFAAVPEMWALSRPGLDYCNIGVMPMNLWMLRESGKADECIRVLNSHSFAFPCQDALCYLCQGGIVHLPSGFNGNPYVVPDGSPLRAVHYAARDNWRDEPPVVEYRNMSWEHAMELHEGRTS